MFKLSLSNIIDCKFSLGEGLHVSSKGSSWVDINKNIFASYSQNNLVKHNFDFTPTVILREHQDIFLLGCNEGLVEFSSKENNFKYLSKFDFHDTNEFRSNDGVMLENDIFIGFMHNNSPDKNYGSIYVVKDSSFKILDSTIKIPNSFIPLEQNKILISDSYSGEVWLYEIRYHKIYKKTLWAHFDNGEIPDGGCVVGNFIFLALWDGASIAVMDKSGNLLQKLPVPVKRPTNCKFEKSTNKLWLTSALEGLPRNVLKKYPNSGNTLVFELKYSP